MKSGVNVVALVVFVIFFLAVTVMGFLVFGSVPVTVTFAFGSKISVTWNGLTWMWNGCAMGGPKVWLTIFHSSTLFNCTSAPTSPSNFLLLIMCCAAIGGLAEPGAAGRFGGVDEKVRIWVPVTSLSRMSSR